jgi:hypothetical protein
MDPRRLEILGREGLPIGHLELFPAGPAEGEYKIVIQLQKGYHVLALRSEMSAGRISGILGRALALPTPPQNRPL